MPSRSCWSATPKRPTTAARIHRSRAEGEARAQALAASLREAPLRAVYATAYKRTQATAAPSQARIRCT
jgi:broad specificity phosphatase PhoE